MNPILLVVLGLALLLFFGTIAIFNGLVALQNRFTNAFAQISVQLKRRYDLIPNLTESAKAYMQHERETLEAVVAARSAALAATDAASAKPGDQQVTAGLVAAERLLSQKLGSFLALAENYPDLKANTTIERLMEELASTENKIAFARQAYNDAVMVYNTRCQVFPANLVGGLLGFSVAAHLNIETKEAPPVRVRF